MIVLAIFSWWYSEGWARSVRQAGDRVEGVLDFFSVGVLLKTLFAPFRQISAGQVRGPAEAQFRAFLDRTFSRFIGAFMRGMMIIAGFLTAVFVGVVGLVQIVVWPLVPLLPLFGLLAALAGWVF